MESKNLMKKIKSWICILIGVVLSLLTLGCLVGSIIILVHPPGESPLFSFVVGLIMVFLCFWVLEKSVRMVLQRPNKGGLMTPRTLRIVAVIILLLPIGGLFTGYYKKEGLIAVLQVISYVII